MTNPAVHMMVSGGQAVLAACGAMVVYGFIRVRRAVSSLSSCDFDGCEMRRLYSEFKTEMETLRRAGTAPLPDDAWNPDIDQAVLEAFFNETPPEDKRRLH